MSSSPASATINQSSPASTRVFLPRALRVFLAVDLALLAGAVAAEFFCRHWSHLGPPYTSAFLNERYPDLLTQEARFQYFHTLKFFTDTVDPPAMYPAPILALYRLLFAFSPHHLAAFFTLVAVSVAIAAILLGRALIRRGLAPLATVLLLSLALATSYPLGFELKQANMEVFVWIAVSVGIWAFLRGSSYTAGACFGIAGAMKMYPFVYLGLLISRRQYKQAAFAVPVAIAVTVPCLWLAYPDIPAAWRLTNQAVANFRQVVVLRQYTQQTGFDHSIFGLIKAIFHTLPPPAVLGPMLTDYLAFAAIAGLLLYVLIIRKLPLTNQVLCLCILSIILPPTSFDYTLMHLYAPWALLVLISLRPANLRSAIPGLTAAFVCFAILFAPETELIRHGRPYGGQIKALTLIALLIIGLRYRFPLEESSPSAVSEQIAPPVPGAA